MPCHALVAISVAPRSVTSSRAPHPELREHCNNIEGVRVLYFGTALNTVKRYAHVLSPTGCAARAGTVPAVPACLFDPYRDHLRRRRAEGPACRSNTVPRMLL
jgi:hypothetical protein